MFLKYLPFAIEQGKIYAANPPLYGFPTSKGKMKFFADNLDYIEWVRGVFCRDNKISDLSGRELSKQSILKLLYDNIDYLKLVTTVSTIYSIDPIFLEFLLYNRELPFNKFKSTVEKAYKYTKVSVENGVTMIRGLVGSAYHTVFFNERLMLECQDIIDLISKHDKYYLLNGQKVTIYSIMSAFANAEPSNITRYKGLGEMPPKLLGESTIIPGLGRTLRRYTIEDVKTELQYISALQSDKSKFIKGVKIRKEDIS